MTRDEYLSIPEGSEATLKVKGSSFIATACPAATEAEALRCVEKISKQYFGATHHCFAYTIGHESAAIQRTHDDGEPSGTAGKPILQAITGRRLSNVVVVVTRYFGGTKLGTGGLARAYSEAASLALDACGRTTHVVYKPLRIRFPYDETNAVMRLVDESRARIRETRYDQDTFMTIEVRWTGWSGFRQRLINATRGKATILGDETD